MRTLLADKYSVIQETQILCRQKHQMLVEWPANYMKDVKLLWMLGRACSLGGNEQNSRSLQKWPDAYLETAPPKQCRLKPLFSLNLLKKVLFSKRNSPISGLQDKLGKATESGCLYMPKESISSYMALTRSIDQKVTVVADLGMMSSGEADWYRHMNGRHQS